MTALTLYRSSAGSGKTFTLVKAYLQLVLNQPQAYQRILAVTFTNKATAELKTRILQNLYSLAEGDNPTMQEALLAEPETNLSASKIPQQAQQALKYLLHDYNRFSVSTIDSFFNRVVRAFARELGLPANFALETDQAGIMDEVTDQLMLRYSQDQQLRGWLQQFALEKMREGRSWQIAADLKNLGRALFSEQYPLIQESIEQANGDLKGFLGPLMKKLREQQQNLEKALQEKCQKIRTLVDAHGLTSNDFAGGSKSSIIKWVNALYEKPSLHQMLKLRDEKLPGIASYEDLVAKSKPQKTKQAVFNCAEAGLWESLEKLAEKLANGIPAYVTAQVILENAYPFGVLGDLNEALRTYRSEHEMLLITDLNNLLKEVTRDVDSPFIYEKVGNTFQHFLLDEFQDTSDFQWDNLRPLLINALSAGHSSLIVGDVKQSIYRWRGGNPDMLVNKLHEDLGQLRSELHEANLNTNRRSNEHIIRFNNALFARLPQYLASQHGEMGSFIEAAYRDVQQECVNDKKGKGYVRVSFLPDSGQAHNVAVEEQMLDTIRELEGRGYQYGEMAILVRDNKEAQAHAQALTSAEPAIPVVSGNSLLIGYSPKVQLLVHAMYYLNNPGDDLSRACLLNDLDLYNRPDAAFDHHERFKTARDQEATKKGLPEAFTANLGYFLKMPLYDLGEALLRTFGLASRYDAYLQRFLDTLLDFSRQQQADVANFLEWWEEEGYKAAVQVPAGENAVTIETIHKAKGLEFPIVLLPDISYGSNGGSDKWLWETAASSGFDALPYWPVKFRKNLAHSYFGHAYEREAMLSTLDTLNVLYVACTRASEGLFIWAPMPVDSKGQVTQTKLNGPVYEILQSLAPSAFHGASDYEETITWGEPLPPKQPVAFNQPNYLEEPPSNSWRGKLNIRPKGSDVLRLYEGEVMERINEGLLMHGILARIQTLQDINQAVAHVYQSGLMDFDEQADLENKVKAILDQPGIREWFEDSDWVIRNEQELLLPGGAAYRPDRVLTKGDQARVMDYKTGEPQRAHHRQVSQYCDLLQQIGYTDTKGFLLYLEQGVLEAVA